MNSPLTEEFLSSQPPELRAAHRRVNRFFGAIAYGSVAGAVAIAIAAFIPSAAIRVPVALLGLAAIATCAWQIRAFLRHLDLTPRQLRACGAQGVASEFLLSAGLSIVSLLATAAIRHGKPWDATFQMLAGVHDSLRERVEAERLISQAKVPMNLAERRAAELADVLGRFLEWRYQKIAPRL